ncbi:soluble inorganic pyrophosphatase 6, chloroplastic-like [Punica granatum]|uniref:inorganic diphosphatase n=1 Tax=Punica granatum TaxID=22663 RepID=A0A6P8DK86_PUNGR|nr:soluble inorganic pyrophosphatase 6, chloroplastic-like [Punica granatum]
MEVAINEPFTWIKQDTKKMNLCYYLYNIHWNYGLLLQTWEDSSFANSDQARAAKIQERKKGKCKYIYLYVFGDSIYLMIFSCLVDVVEIGETGRDIGQILRVKPLASLAVIDEGELDWKTVTISSDDPRASIENDVDDVEKYFLVCTYEINALKIFNVPLQQQFTVVYFVIYGLTIDILILCTYKTVISS